ncbi:integrase [Methanolobus sp. WCC5]|uniref:integrase n=1 Tax=Methanolobus sp. WCC5 TaxID=3125785 RepID=UPI0032493106
MCGGPDEIQNPDDASGARIGVQSFAQHRNEKEKTSFNQLKSTSEEVVEYGGPDEIRTHDPRRVKAKPHTFSTTKQQGEQLSKLWEQHNEYFKSWLRNRNISEGTQRDYYNSLEKFFSNPDLSILKPQDLNAIQLKDKEERGLRNMLNYFEDLDMDTVAGYSLEKWRKYIKIKQSGVVEVYLTDDELREAYRECAGGLKSVFKLMTYSGSRLTHVHEMLQKFDERNIVIDGEVAHYPTSNLSTGTKKTFQIFFPTSFIPELKEIGKDNTYDILKNCLYHKRVSAKTIRKWHLNLMVAEGVTESLADFIQGRASVTVGSAHYLNKVKQAREAYRKIVERLEFKLMTNHKIFIQEKPDYIGNENESHQKIHPQKSC